MARYELPTTTELLELGSPRDHAVTVYAQASAAQYDLARTTVKSAMDRAIRSLRNGGGNHALESALRERTTAILADEGWRKLSHSLAVFITPEEAEMFVLPNQLENQLQVGSYFDVGQLVRAAAAPQDAYALTLSADGWNLWQASGTELASEMEVEADGIGDVAEATNRATVRGRIHARRLHGDEGTKLLLETYAKRVHEVVVKAIDADDPSAERPLFVFAADPLLDMYRNLDRGFRELVAVPGSPDELTAVQIDARIRQELADINSRRANATVEKIADGVAKGLVATDLVDVARAAVAGNVDTLVYDFTVDVLGRLDNETGDVTYADDGYDLLSRIAVWVLQTGGRVIPVRASEIVSDIWNGTVTARLRYPLST
ncbi:MULTISPECIES: hypothetical protein [Gordonia]|uniref:Uncharacterized protein n=2 Tax=Gordonia TaxID=2053 RepID=L7LIG9_9ACTN|nr:MULTISPECIES: hypothetical protein [Gordonia]AUH68680.1 hypothetical protein CXX93_10300 [Gordonia sp. YC-JH1]MBY4571196.1 hypothetical protein [Gordonia sihwensis]GAC59902.1 hypothetical protein GSI01S_06_00560 [Gordonia sihwensis NBRC 108236]